MTKPEISGIAPFLIVRNVPAALSFYRDRLGFDITFQGPATTIFSSGLSSGVCFQQEFRRSEETVLLIF